MTSFFNSDEKNDFDLDALKDLINYSNDMIFVLNIETTTIEYVNYTACNELGYTFEEMKAMGINGFRKSLPNEHTFEEHIKELKNSKDGLTDYAMLVKKDGSEIYIEAKVRILNVKGKNYNIAMVRNITERFNHIKELEYKNTLIQNYFDIVKVLIMVLDRDKNVIMINRAGADILGYPQEEIIGKNFIKNFIPTSLQTEIDNVAKEIVEEKNNHVAHINTIITKDGKERLLSWSNSQMYDEDGNVSGVLSSGIDITEVTKQHEQLIIQSRMAEMGEMISMIAHQWRQPLSVISMTMNNMELDIELEAFDESEAKEYAKQVLEQIQHLSNTIDDFRNFFKSDKELSKVKVADILEQTYSIVKDSLANNNIELKKSYESESKIDVYSRELMQVFVNIINNAKDTLVLNHINEALIEIKVYENENHVITDIHDNGGGIDEKVLPKVFEAYFSTKDEKNGTGLGLHMSKIIIENHMHGTIEALNIENGACFRIMLQKT